MLEPPPAFHHFTDFGRILCNFVKMCHFRVNDVMIIVPRLTIRSWHIGDGTFGTVKMGLSGVFSFSSLLLPVLDLRMWGPIQI